MDGEGVKEPNVQLRRNANSREGQAMSRAPLCLPPVQPLPHIYVRIRRMSEFGRYRRFVKILKVPQLGRD